MNKINELYTQLSTSIPERKEPVRSLKEGIGSQEITDISDEEAGNILDNVMKFGLEVLSPASDIKEYQEGVKQAATGDLMGVPRAVAGLAATVVPGSKFIREGGQKVAEKIQDTIPIFPKPQRMFDEKDAPIGGEYLNPITKEKLTDKNFQSASIGITPEGKPSFTAKNIEVDKVGSPDIQGATQIKTNLFKKKAGWKWLNAPKDYENIPTLVSVENKGKHYYTIQADFPQGINLSRYAKSKTEPRLRPTIKGFVNLGKPIGTISVIGKEHPVYNKIINKKVGGII